MRLICIFLIYTLLSYSSSIKIKQEHMDIRVSPLISTLNPKDGDIVFLKSSVIGSLYVAADTIDCENSTGYTCGQIYSSIEENSDSYWIIKQSTEESNAFCFMAKNTNAYLGFDLGRCEDNNIDYTQCSIPRLILGNECINDYAWILHPNGQDFILQSVIYKNAYLYLDADECRELLNLFDELNSIDRCGNVYIYYASNLQEIMRSEINSLNFEIKLIEGTNTTNITGVETNITETEGQVIPTTGVETNITETEGQLIPTTGVETNITNTGSISNTTNVTYI